MPIKSVQQIMLGSVCLNEEKSLKVLARIKQAGYESIELNSFMVKPSPAIVRILTKAAGMPTGACGKLDWHKLLSESGLSVSAYHTDLGSLERDPAAVFDEAESFGTNRLAITGMYRFDYGDKETVVHLANRLNDAGRKAKEHGLKLFYHNHNAELLKVSDNECAYSVLIKETDPELVFFEFDSFWFADAGASPLEWMETLGTRMKLWHVTDRGMKCSKAPITPIIKSDSTELGTGNMPLQALLSQALKNGVEGITLESHRNWIDNDPVKSLEVSAKWLNENL